MYTTLSGWFCKWPKIFCPVDSAILLLFHVESYTKWKMTIETKHVLLPVLDSGNDPVLQPALILSQTFPLYVELDLKYTERFEFYFFANPSDYVPHTFTSREHINFNWHPLLSSIFRWYWSFLSLLDLKWKYVISSTIMLARNTVIIELRSSKDRRPIFRSFNHCLD